MSAARPIITYYAGARLPAHSTTPKAAARAASRKLLDGQYSQADIYNKDGRLLARLTFNKAGRYLTTAILHPRSFL